MNVLSLGAVAETLVISGQAEDVEDIEGGRAQDVALEGDPVPIPGHHLQNRLQPHQFQADAGGQTAQAGHGGLVVRHVDGVHMVFDHFGLAGDHFRIAAAGGPNLGGDGHLSGSQYLFQFAGCLDRHSFKSSRTTFRGPPARSVDQSLIGVIFS